LDPLRDFISDCTVEVEGSTPGKQLWEAYLIWCRQYNIRPLSRKGFGSRMGKRYQSEHTEKGVKFGGVCLLTEPRMMLPQIAADGLNPSVKAEVAVDSQIGSSYGENSTVTRQDPSAQLQNESGNNPSAKADASDASPHNPSAAEGDSNPLFVASQDWKEVPPGAILPPGLEIRMDLAGGKSFARRDPKANNPSDSACAVCREPVDNGPTKIYLPGGGVRHDGCIRKVQPELSGMPLAPPRH
jgi:hypothetical protein